MLIASGCMALQITLNGQAREFPMVAGAPVSELLLHLELKGDRIAVEQNGTILPRALWAVTTVADGDRFEIVHFVGGGAGDVVSCVRSCCQRWPYVSQPPRNLTR